MKYLLLYYITVDENEDIYAKVEGNDNYVCAYKNSSFKFIDKSFSQIQKEKTLRQISFETMLGYTFGLDPKDLYNSVGIQVYNIASKINKEYDKDFLKKFLNEYKEFAKDDYNKMFHNMNRDLTYSANELDIHYENCGTFEFIDEYYEEFKKRKANGEFAFVEIIKISNDYIMVFNETILK